MQNSARPNDDWYSAGAASASPEAERKRANKRTALIVCGVLLLAAIVHAVFGSLVWRGVRSVLNSRFRVPSVQWSERAEDFFDDFDPDVFDDWGDIDDWGDVRDWLENYTVGDLLPPQSEILRGEPAADFSLPLRSARFAPELTLQQLYAQTVDSIVGIRAWDDDPDYYAWGTGVILSEDGYVVTNQHVISERRHAAIVLDDGRAFDAVLIGEDRQTDLAVLKIEATGLQPAAFGDSAELAVGDAVAAIGNPLGEDFSGTLTTGIVSGIDRDVLLDGRHMSLLQTTAALNSGNSGGALLNMRGQVVGITNMKMSTTSYASASIEGIGLAIPSATVKAVVEQLITFGAVEGRPAIGITVVPLSASERAQYGLPEGLLITAVQTGSDAEAQGIRPGDLLLAVNGEAVTASEDVLAIRDAFAVGDSLRLTLWRDGQTFACSITLFDRNTLDP